MSSNVTTCQSFSPVMLQTANRSRLLRDCTCVSFRLSSLMASSLKVSILSLLRLYLVVIFVSLSPFLFLHRCKSLTKTTPIVFTSAIERCKTRSASWNRPTRNWNLVADRLRHSATASANKSSKRWSGCVRDATCAFKPRNRE